MLKLSTYCEILKHTLLHFIFGELWDSGLSSETFSDH
jgi:hypothetical protein